MNVEYFDNFTLKFQQKRTWHFIADMSNGNLDDRVVTLNVPVVVSYYYYIYIIDCISTFSNICNYGTYRLTIEINIHITTIIKLVKYFSVGLTAGESTTDVFKLNIHSYSSGGSPYTALQREMAEMESQQIPGLYERTVVHCQDERPIVV